MKRGGWLVSSFETANPMISIEGFLNHPSFPEVTCGRAPFREPRGSPLKTYRSPRFVPLRLIEIRTRPRPAAAARVGQKSQVGVITRGRSFNAIPHEDNLKANKSISFRLELPRS